MWRLEDTSWTYQSSEHPSGLGRRPREIQGTAMHGHEVNNPFPKYLQRQALQGGLCQIVEESSRNMRNELRSSAHAVRKTLILSSNKPDVRHILLEYQVPNVFHNGGDPSRNRLSRGGPVSTRWNVLKTSYLQFQVQEPWDPCDSYLGT